MRTQKIKNCNSLNSYNNSIMFHAFSLLYDHLQITITYSGMTMFLNVDELPQNVKHTKKILIR